jgi:ABC-type dipeptide/oligopeptide/nickel transport system permease subunit
VSQKGLPWSFYAVIVTFGIFFFSLNAYILTILLSHPFRSDVWLIGVAVGLVGMLYSVRMVRIHQKERIEAKQTSIVSSDST